MINESFRLTITNTTHGTISISSFAPTHNADPSQMQSIREHLKKLNICEQSQKIHFFANASIRMINLIS